MKKITSNDIEPLIGLKKYDLKQSISSISEMNVTLLVGFLLMTIGKGFPALILNIK